MIVDGKYRLEQRLGAGGFKAVWRRGRLSDGQIPGVPVAVGAPEGRGRATFVFAMGDAIELWDGAACLPGRMVWIGPRGDLWRGGALGVGGLPIGPRV